MTYNCYKSIVFRALPLLLILVLPETVRGGPWSVYLGGSGLRLQLDDASLTDLGKDRHNYFLDQINSNAVTESDRFLSYIALQRMDNTRLRSLDLSSGSLQIRYSEARGPWTFRLGYRHATGIVTCTECSAYGGYYRWQGLDELRKGNQEPAFLFYAQEFAKSQGGGLARFDLLEFGWTYHFRRGSGLDPYLGLMSRMGSCDLPLYGSGSCSAGFVGIHTGLRIRASNRTFLEIEAEYSLGRIISVGRTSSAGLNLGLSWML
ncbi:MAG: hypothetical protein CMN77_12770 [Spirochaetaceae bacterium]|nr:hypothetical protein [Spirochaetaceae bacterium]